MPSIPLFELTPSCTCLQLEEEVARHGFLLFSDASHMLFSSYLFENEFPGGRLS
jgi:hypothetical protein